MTSRSIVFVQFRQDEDTSVTTPMPTCDPDDLIGRTFLLPENEKGECLRVTIKQIIIETSQELDDMHDAAIEHINYLLFFIGQADSRPSCPIIKS